MKVTAPGKLLISGEWSVLETGIPCIVAAVDKRIGVEIEESKVIGVYTPDLGLGKVEAEFDGKALKWKKKLSEEEGEKLIISKNSIEVTLRYLKEKGNNFYITTSSGECQVKMDDGTIKKVGFGASAAACVAIIGAVLKFNGYDLKKRKVKDLVYKLAAIAHYTAQGKVGSAFDIAASTYGGVIVYKRFDPKWFDEEMKKGKEIAEIADGKWKSFYVGELELPRDLILSVAWTGGSASTKELVLKLNSFKESKKERYWEIINSIKRTTEGLIEAIKKGKNERIIELINENRKWLKELSDESGNNLETEPLGILADIAMKNGAGGKFSGAGGGDCGIAVCFDEKIAEKIKNEWKLRGLYPLAVNISKEGVA